MEPDSLQNDLSEELLYHPVSFELSRLVVDDTVESIELTANIAKQVCYAWLVSLHKRAVKGLFSHIPSIEQIGYFRAFDGSTPRVKGECRLASGRTVVFDTSSHFVDLRSDSGSIIDRRLIPEPFSKRYKMLYDRIRGEMR